MGTYSSFLTKFSIVVTSNICVNNLKIKLHRELVVLYFVATKLGEKIELYLLSFIIFEEYMSGERSNEMHVHIDGQNSKKPSKTL